MKNSIKYLFGLLLTPLLCLGVSFGASPIPGTLISSYSLDYNECQYINYSVSLSNFYNSNVVDSVSFGCFYVYGPENSIRSLQGRISNSNHTIDGSMNLNLSYGKPVILCGDHDYLISYLNSEILVDCNPLYQNYYIGFDFYEVSGGGNCSSVESQLNTCLNNYNLLDSQFNALSGQYQSCQSDLSSCTNSCDTLVSQCQEDKASLQSSYSGCLETNASLNNYNTSLQDQLQACYYSGAVSTGDFTIYEYQLSRSDGFTDLYLPITNSIKLPYGYRGFLDNGVLAIKNLDSLDIAYSIEDSDFQEKVVGSYSVVYLFLMSSGLFLIFIYVIRRYFIGLKSAK